MKIDSRAIWILYRESDAAANAFFIAEMAKAFKKRGMEALLVAVRDGIDAVNIDAGIKAIFVGDVSEFTALLSAAAEDGAYPLAVVNRIPSEEFSEAAEKSGAEVFNRAEVSKILNDKYATFLVAKELYPSTETFLCRDMGDADRVGFPLVLKNPRGRGGSEVYLVNNADELKNRFKKGQIAQRFLKDAFGDLRLYVMGGKTIASVLRERGKDFRANVKQGGSARLFEPPIDVKEAAEKLAKKLKADYIGVDFLALEGGKFLFNEAEDCAGARSLYALTDLNAADLFVQTICGRLRYDE